MAATLERVSSTDVSKRFGHFYDEAITHPIAVERNGTARVVMMPVAEYLRLAALDHVALTPQELSRNDIRALRDAKAPETAHALNYLMDDAATG
ncbi:type II toxin-antitoxin system Phd/YefM family antitoxin [Sphingosinicellaceae bacterium]|nr:type II toxin-antitoxin system Phd/YefM family antitoxin [Sphingosinicellaceae bacterium]